MGGPGDAPVHVHVPVKVTVAGTPSPDDLNALEAMLRNRLAAALRSARNQVAAHVVPDERAPARPVAPTPLFRQPEEDDPVEAARRAARNALASLAETIPPLSDDDPKPLISWAASAASRLEKPDDMTRAERIYTARGLVRAYAQLEDLQRRAARAADGALLYHLVDREVPWSEARPRTVEEIPSFTPAAVAEWRALGSLDPDAEPGPPAAAGPRGRPAGVRPTVRAAPPTAAAPAGQRAAPAKLAHTVTFTKPAGLDIDTEEGKLEVVARVVGAMYPQMDDLLLSWVVTKLGTTRTTPQGKKSRFTDAWLAELKQAKEGDPIAITADEALTFEVDGLLLHAPGRVSLIGAEVYRGTAGMKYILAIEFAAALVAFTGGAALGAFAAEGGSVAMTTTAMELEGGGAVAADAGAASQSFGALVRSGVGSLARGAYLNAPAHFATGMAYGSAISAGVTLAGVAQDIQERGFHAYQIGDVAGAVANVMEARMMLPDSPETTPSTTSARGAASPEPEIIVDPSTGTVRVSIRDVRTGAVFDGEFDPVTQTGTIVDRTTGAVIGVIRDGRFYRPDAPSGEQAPGAPAPALPALPPAAPRGSAPFSGPRSRIPPTSRATRFAPITEEDYAGSASPPRVAGGPFYSRPPSGSPGPKGGSARRLAQLEVILPDSHPSYDAVEALSLEAQSLQQAATEGRLTGEAYDARIRDVSDRLQMVANEAPEVTHLLNLDDDTLDRLAASRATDPLTAGQAVATRGASGPASAELEEQGYKIVADRPAAAVSPTERGELEQKLRRVLDVIPEDVWYRRWYAELHADIRRLQRRIDAGELTPPKIGQERSLLAERLDQLVNATEPQLGNLLTLDPAELAEVAPSLRQAARSGSDRLRTELEDFAERQRQGRVSARQAAGEGVPADLEGAAHQIETFPETRGPATGRGNWSGTPRNSDWTPDDDYVLSHPGLLNYRAIPFREGYPDLTKFIVDLPGGGRAQVLVPGDVFFTGGRQSHFDYADAWFARRMGWLSGDAPADVERAIEMVRSYRGNQQLTWHHVEFDTLLQLVPRPIHEAAQHAGGIATQGGL